MEVPYVMQDGSLCSGGGYLVLWDGNQVLIHDNLLREREGGGGGTLPWQWVPRYLWAAPTISVGGT